MQCQCTIITECFLDRPSTDQGVGEQCLVVFVTGAADGLSAAGWHYHGW